MSRRIPKELLVSLLLLLAWGIYLKTMAPELYLEDSGFIITVAYSEGITHPAGCPLYGLLGGLFTKLPFSSIAWRTHLLSAAGAILCLFFVFKMLRNVFYNSNLPAIAGTLFLCSQPHFWEKAVTSEVYAWQLFFTALLFFLLFRLSPKIKDHFLLVLVFFIACGLHVTTIFLLPIFLIYIFTLNYRYRSKHVIQILVLAFIALSLYIYLPLRANKHPLVNWGEPLDWSRFYDHVTDRKDKGNLYSGDLGMMWRQFKYFLGLLHEQYPTVGLVIVSLGALHWWMKNPKMFWFFVLSILPYLIFYCVGSKEKIVVSDNFTTVYLMFLPFWVNGINYLRKWAKDASQYGQPLFYILLIGYLAISLGIGGSKRNLRNFYMTYDFIDNILLSTPKGVILRTSGDTVTSSLAYFQRTLGKRKDLMIYGYLPFKFAPPFIDAPLYSIGGIGSEMREPTGLVNYVRGEKQHENQSVWHNFRRRGPAFDLDNWTDEINAYYAMYRGDYLKLTGKLKQAIISYEKAAIYGSYYSWMSSNIGWRFLEMGELKKAEIQFKRFIKIDQDEPSGYNNLANVYFRLKKYELAETYYLKAQKIAPGSELVRRNLKIVRKLIKRKEY